MNQPLWKITVNVLRQKGPTDKPHFQSFPLEIHPDEYVLDAIEKIWAFQDRSLTFRHACHHATCGACGMRVNGKEKLTCITSLHTVVKNNGVLKIEPLRNFPVLSDLVVDMGHLYRQTEEADFQQVVPLEAAQLPYKITPNRTPNEPHERLVDCIECGLCVSACPAAFTSTDYRGPAALAAIQQGIAFAPNEVLFDLADHENGVWRCHSAFECTEVCPSNVDPGWRIMNLRRRVIHHRISRVFKKLQKVSRP